ncbi:PTS beta-glucoside transporter subunit IIABC [Alphaproteobacteria bacterium]|nr:PTS beta-glucoside transporter subunit IIABC [Alphaproteobacteria bacterium]
MQDQDKAAGKHNPFAKMGMIQFWAISTIVYLTFPVSLIIFYIAFGSLFTKQLVNALVQDFLQNLLVAIGVLIVLIWVIVHYLGPALAGWFGG